MTNSRQIRRGTPEQREAQILGTPPRIPALEVDELTDELLGLVARMIQVNAAVDAREPETLTELMSHHESGAPAATIADGLAELPEIILTMLRHPDLFARQAEIGLQLLGQGALAARDRELAILRVAWLCQAPYEWGEHVHIGKSVGVSSEEVERITHGSSAPGWSDHDRAVLRAVEELHSDAMISDATWAVLTKRLDERQLIELPIVIGQYQTQIAVV